jgi:hypothetical protein
LFPISRFRNHLPSHRLVTKIHTVETVPPIMSRHLVSIIPTGQSLMIHRVNHPCHLLKLPWLGGVLPVTRPGMTRARATMLISSNSKSKLLAVYHTYTNDLGSVGVVVHLRQHLRILSDRLSNVDHIRPHRSMLICTTNAHHLL